MTLPEYAAQLPPELSPRVVTFMMAQQGLTTAGSWALANKAKSQNAIVALLMMEDCTRTLNLLGFDAFHHELKALLPYLRSWYGEEARYVKMLIKEELNYV